MHSRLSSHIAWPIFVMMVLLSISISFPRIIDPHLAEMPLPPGSKGVEQRRWRGWWGLTLWKVGSTVSYWYWYGTTGMNIIWCANINIPGLLLRRHIWRAKWWSSLTMFGKENARRACIIRVAYDGFSMVAAIATWSTGICRLAHVSPTYRTISSIYEWPYLFSSFQVQVTTHHTLTRPKTKVKQYMLYRWLYRWRDYSPFHSLGMSRILFSLSSSRSKRRTKKDNI